MTVLDRLSKIMARSKTDTPAPDSGIGTPVPPSGNGTKPPPEPKPELRPLIVTAFNRTGETPLAEVERCLDEIKRWADDVGPSFAAGEVLGVLDRIKGNPKYTEIVDLKKGHDFASEFHLAHLKRELKGIEDEGRPLGPNLFDSYCRDYVDAKYQGARPPGAIETLVVVAEDLLFRAIHSVHHRKLYVSLAYQALIVAAETGELRWELGLRESNTATRLYRKGETPPPQIAPRKQVISEEMFRYTKNLAERVEGLGPILEGVQGRPYLSRQAIADTPDSPPLRQHLRYVETVLSAAKDCRYPAFIADLKQVTGQLRERIEPGKGRDFINSAAIDLERQAKVEDQIGLTGLAKRRIREANALYQRIKRPEGAA